MKLDFNTTFLACEIERDERGKANVNGRQRVRKRERERERGVIERE